MELIKELGGNIALCKAGIPGGGWTCREALLARCFAGFSPASTGSDDLKDLLGFDRPGRAGGSAPVMNDSEGLLCRPLQDLRCALSNQTAQRQAGPC
jgi:hypothetical protein